MTEWIVPLLGLGAAEPAGLTESMPSRPQLEPMRENRFGKVRQGVNRSIAAIIRSERSCSWVDRAAGSSSMAAARSMARLRRRRDISPAGFSKKPEAPLAAQLGRKHLSQAGSI